MNEDRLRRLHRLRKADTDERALAVARDEARLRATQAEETESIRRRESLRSQMAAAADGGRVRAEVLADRHQAAERGVRSVVRVSRRVAEHDRLLAVSREAARAARTEEERVEVLLTAEIERRRREREEADEKERDEMATIRRRHATTHAGDLYGGGDLA